MTTLHDRLGDLADQVDVAPHPVPDLDLWTLGRSQHRRRQAGAAFAGAAALVLVVGLGALFGLPSSTDRTAPPADAPFGDLHLPRVVHAPSEWAPGTDEAGPLGPVAAIGTATRSHPEGRTGVREGRAVFGLSAVDGSARWLDLPELNFENGWERRLALSPDGTKVGYVVTGPGGVPVGWAVYDTTTGEVVRLRDPNQDVIVGSDVFEIQFSGDSRYLETDYSPTGSDGSRDGTLVIWDVDTGKPTTVEGSGYYWLPNLGSAPHGIVWSRDEETFTYDPETGTTTTRQSTPRIVTWSDGPGSLSAYIDRGERNKDPWRLMSGDGVQLAIEIDPSYLLGWRDARTVVVADNQYDVRYVDVPTGETVGSERLTVAQDDQQDVFVTIYAAGMWANEVVDGVEPQEFEDPRVNPSDIAPVVGPALTLALIGWLLWRRRVRP